MSSNPPTDGVPAPGPARPEPAGAVRRWSGRLAVLSRWPATGWRLWAGRSLRTRLVVAVVGLLAVVCVAIGGVTAVVLHYFLVHQLDQQLTGAAGRAERPPYVPDDSPPAWPGAPSGPPDDVPHTPRFPLGATAGTITAWRGSGEIQASRFDPDASITAQPLTADQLSSLAGLPADRRPHTRTIGAWGDYRLVARQMPDGDVLITGLPLAEVEQTVWWMVATEAGLAGAGLIAAGTAGTLIVRGAMRPLRRVASTAGRVAELPLDRGEVALSVRVPVADTDPRTEVGQVGAALNRMLGHVAAALSARHASETRVRQFVADASHELRTPLAAIRGYAELTRRGSAEVPPDVAHALCRVESESVRMTRLVDDLLLLARLDSGRPLADEPVDLSALLVDVVSDAHAAGADHKWRLELPDDTVLVRGDDERLHQVVGNLLANARTHTPPGTTVTTTLTAEEDVADLTVLDDGPGIPETLQPEIFERFARGDSSRSRAAGSTGLGLSIVAAVVDAHGGAVTVDSRAGRTAFLVRLPLLTADT
jgi:two-component system OmpR family sensor kinase